MDPWKSPTPAELGEAEDSPFIGELDESSNATWPTEAQRGTDFGSPFVTMEPHEVGGVPTEAWSPEAERLLPSWHEYELQDSPGAPGGSIPGGRLVLPAGSSIPDLVLQWNAMTAPTRIDVVVHFHGNNTTGAKMHVVNDIAPISGLDFADPDNPGTLGRRRPTLAILPRGTFVGEHRFRFPALVSPGGLDTLIDDCLRQLTGATGVTAKRGRLVLTAHSGGGYTLERILACADPDEIHFFDAFYPAPRNLIRWVRRHVDIDKDTAVPLRRSGALRALYHDVTNTKTNMEATHAALCRALAGTTGLGERYRIEWTSTKHCDIPRQYGWRLLADSAATLPGTKLIACPRPRRPRAAQPTAAAGARTELFTGDDKPTDEELDYGWDPYGDEASRDEQWEMAEREREELGGSFEEPEYGSETFNGLHVEGVDLADPEVGLDTEELFEAEEFARHAVYEAISDDAPGGTGLGGEELQAVETGSPPPIRTTSQLRRAWRAYECAEQRMVPLRLFGRWNTPVNPATVDAWRALEQALVTAGYDVHRAWVYNCRHIGGQKTRSLHAYGLAIDIDHTQPTCNVNRATPDRRAVRFSSAATKDERCRDVRKGRADTSFTPEQVAAVEAIRTADGHQVFAWGGRWRTTKDTMHFQINVTPEELARGVRADSVGQVQPVTPAQELEEPEYEHHETLDDLEDRYEDGEDANLEAGESSLALTELDTLSEEAEALPRGALSPAPLPFLLAGPIVRRAEPTSVWFWFACSEEIQSCTPSVTVYHSDGTVDADRTRLMVLKPTQPHVARLGERLWVAIVAARPKDLVFEARWTYGYDLAIRGTSSTKSVRRLLPELAYKPFDRPTFKIDSITTDRIVHGSCRRPGGYGQDAFPVFDQWFQKEVAAAAKGKRPPALILTGDQIYADDVAYPLFTAVRKLAFNVFGYLEKLPAPDGKGTNSVGNFNASDWRNLPKSQRWIASSRARLTRRMLKPHEWGTNIPPHQITPQGLQAGSPGEPSRIPVPPLLAQDDQPGRIGFTTEDGEGHVLSFAEYAAMYLLTWNDELWKAYVPEGSHPTDNDTSNLSGFANAVAASRRVLANVPTYMLLDDHEITDDWNLDADWEQATKNPMARRIISNGLAAYWAFQAWGNDPSQFGSPFTEVVTKHLKEISDSRGHPGPAAQKFDDMLHAKHWSYVAPTHPPALCVDTRTRRQFLPRETAILSGPNVWRELTPLLRKHKFKAKEPLLIVLPTPLLPHRSLLYAQGHKYDWPKDRYEGDYESYGNNPAQRADLISFLRSRLEPPTLVVFSGDVHHGSVVDGLYVGGASLQDMYKGKGEWAMRIVQVTSSAIKNIKEEAFVDKQWWTAYQTDAGNVGERIVPQYENMYKIMPDRKIIAMRAAVSELKGDLGRRTYIFENHLCVVDISRSDVEILFIGVKGGRLASATTHVPTTNDPATFNPPLNWLKEEFQRKHPQLSLPRKD